MRFFRTDDDMEMAMLNLVAARAVKWHKEYMDYQAERIIKTLGNALDNGAKHSKQNPTRTK